MIPKLMISCKKATELTEKHIHFNLSLSETIQWRLHTAVCSACKSYKKQSLFLEDAIKKSINQPKEVVQVSDQEAEKLIKKILEK